MPLDVLLFGDRPGTRILRTGGIVLVVILIVIFG